MGTHSSETTRVNNSRSTMIRTLALVAVLVSAVHSYDHICVTNEACKMVSDGVDCSGDCGCGDNMADECGRPHPTTAVHVDTITDCMANCQVFALEQRCKFIIFHYDNIDENCIIMNDDFESYIGHCNRRGQALETDDNNSGWSQCEQFARIQKNATVAVFDMEQSHCEVYGGSYDYDNFVYEGFSRHCQQAMVKLGTDPVACGGRR